MNNPYYIKTSIEKKEARKLGKEVRKIREEQSMNRHDLARFSGMSISYIEKLESENLIRPPSYIKIRGLEKALNTNTGKLLVLATSSRIMNMNEILPEDGIKLKKAIEYLESLKK